MSDTATRSQGSPGPGLPWPRRRTQYASCRLCCLGEGGWYPHKSSAGPGYSGSRSPGRAAEPRAGRGSAEETGSSSTGEGAAPAALAASDPPLTDARALETRGTELGQSGAWVSNSLLSARWREKTRNSHPEACLKHFHSSPHGSKSSSVRILPRLLRAAHQKKTPGRMHQAQLNLLGQDAETDSLGHSGDSSWPFMLVSHF